MLSNMLCSSCILNPITKIQEEITEIKESVDVLKNGWDKFWYWINPSNWIKDGWSWIDKNISSGSLDVALIIFTIVMIWFWMLDVKKAKKITIWTWIIFWVLRGMICI